MAGDNITPKSTIPNTPLTLLDGWDQNDTKPGTSNLKSMLQIPSFPGHNETSPSLPSGSQTARTSSGPTRKPQPETNEMSNKAGSHTSRYLQPPVVVLRPSLPSSPPGPSSNPSEQLTYGSKEWFTYQENILRQQHEFAVAYEDVLKRKKSSLEPTDSMSHEEADAETAKFIEQRHGKISNLAPKDFKTWLSIMHQMGVYNPTSPRDAEPDALTTRLLGADPGTHLTAPIRCAFNKLKTVQWDGEGIAAIQFLEITKNWYFTRKLYRDLIAQEAAQLPGDGPGTHEYEADLKARFPQLPYLLTHTSSSGVIAQLWWEFNRPYAPDSVILDNDDIPALNFSTVQYDASEPDPFPSRLWRTTNGPPLFNAYELSGMDVTPPHDPLQYQREVRSISYTLLRLCMGHDYMFNFCWRPVYHVTFGRNPSRSIGGWGTVPFTASQLPRVQVAPELAVYLSPMKAGHPDFVHQEWRREVERVVTSGVDVRVHPPRHTFVIHDSDLEVYEKRYQQWQEAVDALRKVREWMTRSWVNWRAAIRISTLYPEQGDWMRQRDRLVHDEEIFGLGYTVPKWMLGIWNCMNDER